jgi:hypothetical protein
MLVVALHLRSVAPVSSSHDQLESWGPEGRSMAQKLMAHVVARAQCALLKAHRGMAKAVLTRVNAAERVTRIELAWPAWKESVRLLEPTRMRPPV